jgi:hypothetical protein
MKIFIGPTRPGNIPADADIRPPAQQGDIAAAALEGADTLILIDGFFHQTLAPWHKEILFAIERGCRVIGAGSLGALRAVECARYGAEPVGVIAGWYADESCTDDADVALAHGHADDGYRALSVPLVNLRATAEHLVASGLMPAADLAGVLSTARSIYYVERSWPRLRQALGLIADLLRENYRDQKALDAEEAIRHAQHVAAPVRCDTPQHIHTAHLRALLDNDLPTPAGRTYTLFPDAQRQAATDARLLAELAQAAGITITPHDIIQASRSMWNRLGIQDEKTASDWLLENQIPEASWTQESMNEALRTAARNWLSSASNSFDAIPITKLHTTIHAS